MAVASGFVGSGEFVPVREWTCANHDQPEYHECDCDLCTWEQPECCKNAEWVDKVDADGNAVMREVGVYEHLMSKLFSAQEAQSSALVDLMGRTASGTEMKIRWLEDEAMPKITGDG